MQTITLKPLQHRGAERIGIYFENYTSLNTIVRKQADAKWSQTKKCWYIPYTQKHYSLLQTALKEKVILNIDELKKYAEERKKGIGTKHPTSQSEFAARKIEVVSKKNLPKQRMLSSPLLGRESVPIYREVGLANRSLSVGWGEAVNKHVLPAMKQQLVLKGYSPSTIKTYLNEMGVFLKAIKQHPADEFGTDRIKKYLQYCFEDLKLSENTIHSRLNALKFYYEQILKKEKFFWEIPRPKKPLLLPKLLNERELKNLFNALANKKHKAMLFTAYSAGLRVSEIVNLKIADIDSKRMQIFIARAKGKKDRYVNLSPVLLDILRSYMKTYKPKPKIFLFESEQTNDCYPTRTVQQVFTNAKNKAGIKKEVGVHSLRHSFATHLLDKGTDIRYIKDLLGHFDIKTTERYLHVSKQKLVNIISPLDDLVQKEGIEW
jgi:integrase/recombinase XerD